MKEKLFNAHFKEFYRQDEIYKKIIRRLVRRQRCLFKAFMAERGFHELQTLNFNEQMLEEYLIEKFHMGPHIRMDELEFAKSTIYTFGAKTRECLTPAQQRDRVKELRNQFLEKGTQREAEKFFKSAIGFKVFFHDFACLLVFGNRECN